MGNINDFSECVDDTRSYSGAGGGGGGGGIWKKKYVKNIVHRFHYFTNKYMVKEIYSKEKIIIPS